MFRPSVDSRIAALIALHESSDDPHRSYSRVTRPTTDSITSPIIVPHRGSAAVLVENSASAMREIIDRGANTIEFDVQVTSDGVPVVMHDTTLTRTTTSTGNVSALTAAQWDALVLDPSTYLAAGYANEAPPRLSAIMSIAKNRALMIAEAKVSAAAQPLVDAALAAGIEPNGLIVQSFTLADLTPAVTAGYGAMLLATDMTSLVMADVAAAGVRWIGYGTDDSASAGEIAAARSLGIRCVRWTVNRRVEMSLALSNGAAGVMSDEWEYLKASGPLSTQDSWSMKRWMPGMRGATTNRGDFFDGGWWGFTSTVAGSYLGALQGWACPLPASHTIEFDAQFTGTSATDRWFSAFVCAPNDELFGDNNGVDQAAGYHLLVRRDGRLQIYKKAAGAASATLLATTTGTAIALNTPIRFSIAVTPSSVTLTRTDNNESVTFADTEYRGGYFHLGRNGAAVRFRNLTTR